MTLGAHFGINIVLLIIKVGIFMTTVKEFWEMSVEDREKLSQEELMNILNTGTEELLSKCPPNKVLKLRQLTSKCNAIRNTIKNPFVAAQSIYHIFMQEGLAPMDRVLNGHTPLDNMYDPID